MRSLVFLPLAALFSFASPALANDSHRPAAPVAVQAANGATAGNVSLTWQAVKGATRYEVSASRETEHAWQSVATTTEPSYEFVELPEGTRYYFRVASHTKAGQSDWSSAVMVVTGSAKGSVAALLKPAPRPMVAPTPGR